VAFSPDGARILSGSWDSTIKLWDVTSGALIRTFDGHSHTVYSVAFSPDATRVLSGSGDNMIKLWDADSGALLRTFDGHSHTVYSVAFSPDATHVLSGSGDNTIKLWDAASGALLRTFDGHSNTVHSVAFSPDGTRVLSGSGDNIIKLWDAASGALISNLVGHSGSVTSVAFSPDGARILSSSFDRTVRIWNLATGDLLASLLAGRDGEWQAMTPAGFFAASRKGNGMSGVVRGLNVITIDQVHQSLFNPDLVRETLAGDPDGEVRDAAKVINLENVVDSGPAPVVAITSHPQGSQSPSDLVTVQVRVTDKGKGIGRVEWRVNGITAGVAAKPSGTGPDYPLTQQIALDPGDNIIEVVAYNESNILASLPARTTILFTGPADRVKPRLHILAIGINKYVDRGWTPPNGATSYFSPLSLAVKDAKTFGAEMKRAAGDLYDDAPRVMTVLDEEATREKLDMIIDKLAGEIQRRDTFILFAAAHGISESGRFYLIPQDYDGGANPTSLAQRAIDQNRLQDWLANRIKAKKALVLLDTCESGALVGGYLRSRTDLPASEAGVGRLHEATGRPVLTAAASRQFAHEGIIAGSGEQHGVFTWALLDALRKGDTNGDGLIQLSELVAHVQSVVPKIAEGLVRAAITEPVDGVQTPRFGSRGEDFPLVRRLQ
jgi:hypothetical protein